MAPPSPPEFRSPPEARERIENGRLKPDLELYEANHFLSRERSDLQLKRRICTTFEYCWRSKRNAKDVSKNKSLTRISEHNPLKNASLYCTFTALLCKSFIINGAGEGNRILVIIPFLNPADRGGLVHQATHVTGHSRCSNVSHRTPPGRVLPICSSRSVI